MEGNETQNIMLSIPDKESFIAANVLDLSQKVDKEATKNTQVRLCHKFLKIHNPFIIRLPVIVHLHWRQ